MLLPSDFIKNNSLVSIAKVVLFKMRYPWAVYSRRRGGDIVRPPAQLAGMWVGGDRGGRRRETPLEGPGARVGVCRDRPVSVVYTTLTSINSATLKLAIFGESKSIDDRTAPHVRAVVRRVTPAPPPLPLLSLPMHSKIVASYGIYVSLEAAISYTNRSTPTDLGP